MRTIEILDTPLAVTTYADLEAHCRELAKAGRTHAIDFSNTHIITLRRHEPDFRSLTSHFDLFIPDGMPLVWCLNQNGAQLSDRVYGPTFMRRVMDTSGPGLTNYIIGGSWECGERLRQRFPSP